MFLWPETCCRNLTLIYINQLVVKLVLLYRIQEPIEDIKWGLPALRNVWNIKWVRRTCLNQWGKLPVWHSGILTTIHPRQSLPCWTAAYPSSGHSLSEGLPKVPGTLKLAWGFLRVPLGTDFSFHFLLLELWAHLALPTPVSSPGSAACSPSHDFGNCNSICTLHTSATTAHLAWLKSGAMQQGEAVSGGSWLQRDSWWWWPQAWAWPEQVLSPPPSPTQQGGAVTMESSNICHQWSGRPSRQPRMLSWVPMGFFFNGGTTDIQHYINLRCTT